MKKIGFNPYFNGYCSYTGFGFEYVSGSQICFNPYFNGYCSYTHLKVFTTKLYYIVSILILMDIALILFSLRVINTARFCFNPYFNGYCSYTYM